MRPRVLVLIGTLVVGGAGCTRSSTERFPRAPLILVSIDTLRADHLPAYGYAGVQTPHLDRFRQGRDPLRERLLPRPPDPARARLDPHRASCPSSTASATTWAIASTRRPIRRSQGLLKAARLRDGRRGLRLRPARRRRGIADGLRLLRRHGSSLPSAPTRSGASSAGATETAVARPLVARRREGAPVLPLLPHLRAPRALRAARALQEPLPARLRRGDRGRGRQSWAAFSTTCGGSAIYDRAS